MIGGFNMKKYDQPIMQLIELAYGEIETGLFTASSEQDESGSPSLSFDQIIGGHYSRQ